jgi:hypothetical protein
MSKFYGEVQLKFESGNIVHIRAIKNMKIEDVAVRFNVGDLEHVVVSNTGSDSTPE